MVWKKEQKGVIDPAYHWRCVLEEHGECQFWWSLRISLTKISLKIFWAIFYNQCWDLWANFVLNCFSSSCEFFCESSKYIGHISATCGKKSRWIILSLLRENCIAKKAKRIDFFPIWCIMAIFLPVSGELSGNGPIICLSCEPCHGRPVRSFNSIIFSLFHAENLSRFRSALRKREKNSP